MICWLIRMIYQYISKMYYYYKNNNTSPNKTKMLATKMIDTIENTSQTIYSNDILENKDIFNTNDTNLYELILEFIDNNSILISGKNYFENDLVIPPDYSNVYLYKNMIWKFIKHDTEYINRYYNLINNKQNNITSVLLPLYILKDDGYIIEKFNYYPNTDLFEIITNDVITSHKNKLFLVKYMIESLAEIHNAGIAHRDIKLENILYIHDQKRVLFIDLVMGHHYYDSKHYSGGTLSYAAPELFYDDIIVHDWRYIDIWSLGIVIYAIVFCGLPWNNSIDCLLYKKYYNKIQRFKTIYYWGHYDISSIYKILLSKTLEIDYTKRANINELLELVNNYIEKHQLQWDT